MNNEQQRKILECADKACGVELDEETREPFTIDDDGWYWWNPLTNPADTAEMCAELGICTLFFDSEQKVSCGFLAQDKGPTLAHIEPYGNSRLKAWMYAATMVAAKIGGYWE